MTSHRIAEGKEKQVSGLSMTDLECLKYSPLINGLPEGMAKDLIENGIVRSYKKGEFLFMAGDPLDTVFFIMSGKLKEYYSTEMGDICLRRILLQGGYISLHSIFSNRPYHTYTCEVVHATVCFSWKTKFLFKHLTREPELGLRVAQILSGCFETSCRLNCLCRKPNVESRVAGYLLRQCNDCPTEVFCSCPRHGSRTQADIRPLNLTANDICIARETFSRILSSFQTMDLIRIQHGMVEILDIEALKKISGGE